MAWLPAAVVRPGSEEALLLRQAEVDAERVVGILRIGVALALLAAIFLLAGEDIRTLETYLRRQWVVAFATIIIYFIMGAATLWLAQTRRFRSWMVWPGVTLDCAFMLLNVWAGLQNTGVPGDLTFLLPPAWLVPVVMAFALLRFNPWLQAYCALLICAGLTVMVLWVPVEISPDAAVRVRDMVSAETNAARLVMILLGGVVLVAAAYRMRELLHRSITEAQARAGLTRYLPGRLAGRIEAGGLEDLRQGQRQNMAVLFIDVRGFTSWAEDRDPQEVGSFITEFRTRVQRAAASSGGLVDKFIGDAAMILFEGGAAAARALDCAGALMREMQDWSAGRAEEGQPPVRTGIGLHWGEVFSGVVGNEARLEYTVFGDTVNIAARLEQLTKQENMGVIASQALLQAAGQDTPDWTPLPAVPLRGRRAELEIFGRAAQLG